MNNYKELVAELRRYFYDEELILDAADAIEQLIKERDAEPVRHGHWEKGRDMMTCTNCCEQYDACFKNDYNYCPNCGAKMDEVRE